MPSRVRTPVTKWRTSPRSAESVAAALACAGTAMGWNGVFYGALTQLVARAEVAGISGAAQFFTFAGGMLGPLLFGEAVRAGAGYPLAWVVVALIPATAAAALARALRRARDHTAR